MNLSFYIFKKIKLKIDGSRRRKTEIRGFRNI